MSPADESGAFVGYTYEYFERLAQYTGWSYEFVPVEGSGPAAYKTLRDLLGAGDADVAVGLMATQEGRESLAFTRDSFAALTWCSEPLPKCPMTLLTRRLPITRCVWR